MTSDYTDLTEKLDQLIIKAKKWDSLQEENKIPRRTISLEEYQDLRYRVEINEDKAKKYDEFTEKKARKCEAYKCPNCNRESKWCVFCNAVNMNAVVESAEKLRKIKEILVSE